MKIKLTCDRTCPYQKPCKFQFVFGRLGPTLVLSHVTEIDVQIKDLDALETACAKRGLQLRRGQRTYKWYGKSVGDYPVPKGMTAADLGKCDHAIFLSRDAYEIGVREQADGTFRLVWDFWNGGYGMQAAVGKDCNELIADYTIECAKNAARAEGWMFNETSAFLEIYVPDTGRGGGTLRVSRDGTVDAMGFTGTGCARSESIEKALGVRRETSLKPEYFADTSKVAIKRGTD